MRELNNIFKRIIWNTKANFISINETRGKSIILVYHGIVHNDPFKFNYRFISLENFDEQIKLIKENFNVVSVEDIFKGNINPNALNIALTFDDGYKNNFSLAAEVLKQYNCKATFLISPVFKEGYNYLWTDFLDMVTYYYKTPLTVNGEKITKHKGDLINSAGIKLKELCQKSDWDYKKNVMKDLSQYEEKLHLSENKIYWELMNEQEIKELSKNELFDIGSHGFYHNKLNEINSDAAKLEMNKSKSVLEEIIGKQINILVYPHGSYSAQTLQLASEAGYLYQLIDSYNQSNDLNNLKIKERYGINPFLNSSNQIKYIKRGYYK